MKNIIFCSFYCAILITTNLGCSEGDESHNSSPNQGELQGKWFGNIGLQQGDIISSTNIDFDGSKFTVIATCKRDDKLFIRVHDDAPFELRDGVFTLKENIDLRMPYRINGDKIEMPNNIADIKNFSIDKNTLFCELKWEKGEYKYKLTKRDKKRELEIFREGIETSLGKIITTFFLGVQEK